MKLTIKENSKNYTCTVVKINQLFPIEGADKIQRAYVLGNDVVCSKTIQQNDTMLYFVSGTKLNKDFCIENNLLTDAKMNKDKVRGYLSHKQLRVKAIKLKGVVSDGILLPLSSLSTFIDNPDKLKVGDEFTDIDGFSLCEKYVTPIQKTNTSKAKQQKSPKISRLVENQFYLHGDTSNLRRNIDKINPNDIIGIHYKKHGTSVVIGNVMVKRKLSWLEKLAKKLGVVINETEYDILYSSRKVVKNGYLNTVNDKSFYGEDIWGVVAKEVGHLIPKNWTLYGEIIGYTPSGSAIQENYDYGCKVGEHKFYVYKISVVNEDGNVIFLTDKQIEEYCEKVGLLYKDTFIYYGIASDWYDGNITEGAILKVKPDEWRNTFLEHLEKTYNEKNCYMCTNKVPEEGIILRIEKLNEYVAYKLKSKRFLFAESEEQEKGISNVEDLQE